MNKSLSWDYLTHHYRKSSPSRIKRQGYTSEPYCYFQRLARPWHFIRLCF